MSRIELSGVTKRWDAATAVEDLSLAIDNGEFVAILGPSGCGKSTTLFLLAGIYAPTQGDILFDGARVNEVETRQRNVGIVFQSYALYPHMSVRDNILFPLRFQGGSAVDNAQKAERAAALVQVGELLSRKPSELSGGQQQRVALARALVKAPRLLLLDEPLSNLDATLRLQMRTEIRRIQKDTGVTTVLVTHDQIEATTMADRIVVMKAGRIEQVGTPDELYRAPATRFVAGFVGSPPINFFDYGSGARPFALTAGSAAPRTVGIRPEHLSLAEGGLPGTVSAIEPLGRETLTLAETPAGPLRYLEAGSPRARVGEPIHLTWDPDDSLAFDASDHRLTHTHVAPPTV
ncbi:MAG: ABC transporter ATP-binding protein [Acuticoccus sp.]